MCHGQLCVQVNEQLFAAGFMSEADTDAGDTLNKKVRNAQLAQFNYILGKMLHITYILYMQTLNIM